VAVRGQCTSRDHFGSFFWLPVFLSEGIQKFLFPAAAVPLIIDITVAIATTKIPMWLSKGFWPMAHEARTDYCMLLRAIFLLIGGGGSWSLDRLLWEPTSHPDQPVHGI
jgi:hypothetical protein